MNKRGTVNDLVSLAVTAGDSHRRVVSTFATRATDEVTWRGAAAEANKASALFEGRLAGLESELRAADPQAIDVALTFLEADPWGFRSGYAKERLLRRLRPLVLDDDQERRCVDVVKVWTCGRPRREFRQLTRFARRFDAALHPWVLTQLAATDAVTRRQALWLVFALPGPVAGPDNIDQVRRGLVEACSGDPQLWRRGDWLRQAVHQTWTAEWGEDLTLRALGADGAGLSELRLLGYSPVLALNSQQRQRLRHLILEDVRTNSLRLPFESLACWIPDESFVSAAEALRLDPDPNIAMRAGWVARAIHLSRGEPWLG